MKLQAFSADEYRLGRGTVNVSATYQVTGLKVHVCFYTIPVVATCAGGATAQHQETERAVIGQLGQRLVNMKLSSHTKTKDSTANLLLI